MIERKIACYFAVGKHEKGIFLSVHDTGRTYFANP